MTTSTNLVAPHRILPTAGPVTPTVPHQSARYLSHIGFDGAQPSIEVRGEPVPGQDEVLTPEALAFLTALHRRFAGRRADLLADRQQRRQRIAGGVDPGFLPETSDVRDDPSWQVAPPVPG